MTTVSAKEAFDAINEGDTVEGHSFAPTRETIKRFAEASLDFNPLHFDDNFMANDFGKTNFGGVIMHGMQNFALITRSLTDWLIPRGGYHRRLETRWLKPVKPGDTITPSIVVSEKVETAKGRWIVFEVEVFNQNRDCVAAGRAMAEFPDVLPIGAAVS